MAEPLHLALIAKVNRIHVENDVLPLLSCRLFRFIQCLHFEPHERLYGSRKMSRDVQPGHHSVLSDLQFVG
jgi:hypothetical protein